MSQIPLRVTQLTKIFEQKSLWSKSESFTAVDRISFEVKPGEILGLLGPNGAGKTTTIHLLLGVTQLTSGRISYFGKDFQKHRSEIMQEVTFASTYSKLLGRLTIYENLSFYGQLYGLAGAEKARRIEYFLKEFDLWDLKDRRAAALSAGESSRALLAKAFLPHPKMVLLDEPTAALDPDIAVVVREFLLTVQKEHGVSVVFTSHNMNEVTELCDRVVVMKDGKIIEKDAPESLAASVSYARIELFSKNLGGIKEFARRRNLTMTDKDQSVVIEIEEHRIAGFLSGLTKNSLSYTQISIDKPSLEDYFIELNKKDEV